MKGARGMLIPHGCFGCRTANGRYIPQPPSKGGGKIRALNKKRTRNFLRILYLAEREGFEPPVPLSTTVFKTAAIDHSAISPKLLLEVLSFKSDAKVRLFFESASVSEVFFRFCVIFLLRSELFRLKSVSTRKD